MNLTSLSIFLPIVFWPLTWVIVAKYGRKIGSIKTAFYRQLTIILFWSPILYFLISYKSWALYAHRFDICIASISGAIFLITNILSSNLLPFAITRIFYDSTRIVASITIWYFLLSEIVSKTDIVWIIILFAWFYAFSFTKIENTHLKIKNIPLGVGVSILNGFLFIVSIYYFKLYSQDFTPLESAYILEGVNGSFLFIYLLFLYFLKHENHFQIEKKDFLLLLSLSPFALLASFGLAMAYQTLPFFLINLLFILQFILGVYFGYVFLKEKLSKKQIAPIGLILLGLMIIVLR